MSNETVFALKFIVTVIVAAALSFTLRAAPVNALGQEGDGWSGILAGGEPSSLGRGIVPSRAPPGSASGDLETELAAGMIAYYQRAIDAAKADIDRGMSPELKEIAERSIALQEASVEELRAWLAAH